MRILLVYFVLVFSLASNANAGDKHHTAVFLGATHAHKVSYGTVGLEYEFRYSDMWGVGFLLETIASNPAPTVAAVLGFMHLNDSTKAFVGLGQESVSGHSSGLTRLGVAYDFHLSKYTVSPTLAYDLIQGGHSAVVYGVAIGSGF